MNRREIARMSKALNAGQRLQITKTATGYNAYRAYGNDYYQDDADEHTIGFIDRPMTVAQVTEWLTDMDISLRGGARANAGRKKGPVKRMRNFRLTEDEYRQVKEFVDKLRAK